MWELSVYDVMWSKALHDITQGGEHRERRIEFWSLEHLAI